LGLPRCSRRARAACEFILENHLNTLGDFTGMRDLSLRGMLIHALVYFVGPRDPRVTRLLQRLTSTAPSDPAAALFALSALADIPENERPEELQFAVHSKLVEVLNALAGGAYPTMGAFPPFDGGDAVLALRVLARLGRLGDPRAQPAIGRLWERQKEGGRWALERSFNGMLLTAVEPAGVPSRWATLNALRIITRIPVK
jgi:hypothetical protein